MIEFVASKDELISLVAGNIRYALEKESIRYNDMAGHGVMISPEVRVIVNFTGISKAKDPQRIISLKVNFGVLNRYGPEYEEKLKEIHKAIKDDFPEVLEGGFQ